MPGVYTICMINSSRLKELIPIGIFTLGYTLVALWFALANGNGEFLYYVGVMVLLILAVLFVDARIRLSHGVLWALSVWGLAHMAGGLVPVPTGWPINGDIRVLYSWWLIPDLLKYDHVIHAYGFGTCTVLCYQGLSSFVPNLRATFGVLTLCVLGAMGLGAVNEIVEFVATLLIPNTNVGGYINTGWDLVSNMTGAVLAACVIRVRS